MNGNIFAIEEFATFDGPGIRTTIFLKGCPLSCLWCHNPESQSFDFDYIKNFDGCLNCQKCMEHIIKTSDGFRYTKDSKNICPKQLIGVCGYEISSATLVNKILKNQKILNSCHGGITFSGGEPLSQAQFVIDCIDKINGRVNCAIQTCGFTNADTFKKILEKADYFLFDLKIFEDKKHKFYCGQNNSLILQNYKELVRSGKSFITRVPLIPGITDTDKNLKEISSFIASLGVKEVELLPYNKMAGSKYKALGKIYTLNDLDKKKINENVIQIFKERNIKARIL